MVYIMKVAFKQLTHSIRCFSIVLTSIQFAS